MSCILKTPYNEVKMEWTISRIFDISYIRITPHYEMILEHRYFGSPYVSSHDRKISQSTIVDIIHLNIRHISIEDHLTCYRR
jgi:hypothetical protein